MGRISAKDRASGRQSVTVLVGSLEVWKAWKRTNVLDADRPLRLPNNGQH